MRTTKTYVQKIDRSSVISCPSVGSLFLFTPVDPQLWEGKYEMLSHLMLCKFPDIV